MRSRREVQGSQPRPRPGTARSSGISTDRARTSHHVSCCTTTRESDFSKPKPGPCTSYIIAFIFTHTSLILHKGGSGELVASLLQYGTYYQASILLGCLFPSSSPRRQPHTALRFLAPPHVVGPVVLESLDDHLTGLVEQITALIASHITQSNSHSQPPT